MGASRLLTEHATEPPRVSPHVDRSYRRSGGVIEPRRGCALVVIASGRSAASAQGCRTRRLGDRQPHTGRLGLI
jgi:hypothetical protein